MYEGEDRTRTMGIYVDGALQTTWTSSGTTTDFENVALDVSGNVVELRGVLGDSEWLSVMEVRSVLYSNFQSQDCQSWAAITAEKNC